METDSLLNPARSSSPLSGVTFGDKGLNQATQLPLLIEPAPHTPQSSDTSVMGSDPHHFSLSSAVYDTSYVRDGNSSLRDIRS